MGPPTSQQLCVPAGEQLLCDSPVLGLQVCSVPSSPCCRGASHTLSEELAVRRGLQRERAEHPGMGDCPSPGETALGKRCSHCGRTDGAVVRYVCGDWEMALGYAEGTERCLPQLGCGPQRCGKAGRKGPSAWKASEALFRNWLSLPQGTRGAQSWTSRKSLWPGYGKRVEGNIYRVPAN